MPRRQQLDASRSTTAPPDLLTVAETAAVLRCGLTFVYESIHRYLATGDPDEVPGRKVGRSLRVPRVGLERYIGAAITVAVGAFNAPASRSTGPDPWLRSFRALGRFWEGAPFMMLA